VNRSVTERGGWLPLVMVVFSCELSNFETNCGAEFDSLAKDGPDVLLWGGAGGVQGDNTEMRGCHHFLGLTRIGPVYCSKRRGGLGTKTT
jgi:hypothetical protein